MNSLRIPLQDRTIPYWSHNTRGQLFPGAFDKVLDQLHILAIGGKDSSEFILSRLKHTEGSVERSIDDQYVLQRSSPHILERLSSRTVLEGPQRVRLKPRRAQARGLLCPL